MTTPAAPRGLRLAVTGIENSHVDHVLQAFNRDGRAGPHRVVALLAGEPERTRTLVDGFGVEHVADAVGDLVDRVDAVVVCDRHGGLHRERVVPFLSAGKPAWVDKPLACDPEDARAIVAAAADSGAGLFSCSTVRFAPDVEAACEAIGRVGEIRSVAVSGPADPESVHGGIFFYGIHAVDTAVRFAALAGGGLDLGAVAVSRLGDAVHAMAEVGRTEVHVSLIRPGTEGRTPFHLTVVGTEGVISREIVLGPHYLRSTVDRFVALLDRQATSLTTEEMLTPVDVLHEVATHLAP